MSKKVLILLAEGFEEIEAVTPMDVLRRAGLEVTIAGVTGENVKGAHGITLAADLLVDQYHEIPDALILPGGMPGARNLARNPKVAELIKKVHAQKKIIGAICASPAITVAPTGVLNGRTATCYPGFEKDFPKQVKFSEDSVVINENIITSRGPGTAMEFSLKLVEQLVGKEKAQGLKKAMIVE